MGFNENVEMSTLPNLNLNYSPSEESNHHLVSANYSKLSDHIRRLTPQGIQCSVFCGGTNCKYENPENWTADSLAIQGIYSHWYTIVVFFFCFYYCFVKSGTSSSIFIDITYVLG